VACVGDVVHVERFKGELPQWIEVIWLKRKNRFWFFYINPTRGYDTVIV
jgi:hypothetical protein